MDLWKLGELAVKQSAEGEAIKTWKL